MPRDRATLARHLCFNSNWLHATSVSLGRQNFKAFMKYLAVHKCRVIPLRDLEKYIDFQVKPGDYSEIIPRRQRQ